MEEGVESGVVTRDEGRPVYLNICSVRTWAIGLGSSKLEQKCRNLSLP